MRFIDNNDGTIIDTTTWLMWEKEGYENPISFKTAVESLSYNRLRGSDTDYKDWRLPTVQELISLINYNKKTMIMVDEIFNYNYAHYWTFNIINKFDVYLVNMKNGLIYTDSKSEKHYIRCVRTMTEKEIDKVKNKIAYNKFANEKCACEVIQDDEPQMSSKEDMEEIFNMGDKNKMINSELPRRVIMDQWCDAEKAIQKVVDMIEIMGADTSLTDATVLLGQARDKVADFIDGIKLDKSDLPVKINEDYFKQELSDNLGWSSNVNLSVLNDIIKIAKEYNWIIEEKKDPLKKAEEFYEILEKENDKGNLSDIVFCNLSKLRELYLKEIKRQKEIIDNIPFTVKDLNLDDIKLGK